MRLARLHTLALTFAVGLAACADDNQQAMLIESVMAPATATGMAAAFCGSSEKPIVSGVVDLALVGGAQDGYLMFTQVLNRNQPNGPNNNMVETAYVTISSVDIDLSFDPPPPVTLTDADLHVREDLFAIVNPGGTAEIPIDAMPLATMRKIAASHPKTEMSAHTHLRFNGHSAAFDVNSSYLDFPVRVCEGCLVHDVGPCCAKATNYGLCNPDQDVSVDCCMDGSGNAVCPAQPVAGSNCPTTTP
jgi:hypothetical protein